MLNISNFFGIDLKKMPNQFCTFNGSRCNTSGEIIKTYSYRIDPCCENHYFDSVDIKVIGDNTTNFVFESIDFKIENAVDIAFVIERDLFNNGNLKYLDYFHEHSKEFHDNYFTFEWELDNVTIRFFRCDSELSLIVWSKSFYDMKAVTKRQINLIEGNIYPQGMELENYIPKRDLNSLMVNAFHDFESRYIKIRIEATDEALLLTKTLLERIIDKEDVVFLGLYLNNAPILFEPDTKSVLPLALEKDRESLKNGAQILAVVEEIDTDNVSEFIDFILFISINKNKESCYMNSEQLFNYLPKYVKKIIEQYAEITINDEAIIDTNQRIVKEFNLIQCSYLDSNKKEQFKIIKNQNIHSNIVGAQYHADIEQLMNKLSIGTKLQLKHEPTNPYDSQAIAVYFENEIIGYIPKCDIPIVAINIPETGGDAYVEKLENRLIGISIRATFERLKSEYSKQFGEFGFLEENIKVAKDKEYSKYRNLQQSEFLDLVNSQTLILYDDERRN